MIEGRTIFITGGAAFMGSTIVGRPVERNRVIALADMIRNALRHRPYSAHPNLEVRVGDVLNYHDVARCIDRADYEIHCAVIACIEPSSKAKDLIGFEARIDLNEGIRLTANHHSDRLSAPVFAAA